MRRQVILIVNVDSLITTFTENGFLWRLSYNFFSDITSCIKNLKSADWMDEKLATAEALIIEGKDTMRARCSMVRHVSHEVSPYIYRRNLFA